MSKPESLIQLRTFDTDPQLAPSELQRRLVSRGVVDEGEPVYQHGSDVFVKFPSPEFWLGCYMKVAEIVAIGCERFPNAGDARGGKGSARSKGGTGQR